MSRWKKWFCMFCLSMALMGCSGKVAEDTIVMNIEAGLTFPILQEWIDAKNINLLPEILITPDQEIYSKIQYDYAPDASLQSLMEQSQPIEYLKAPAYAFVVVKEENLYAQSVQNYMSQYDTTKELGIEDNFYFYFLTNYNGDVSFFAQKDLEMYEKIQEQSLEVMESAEITLPDEAGARRRIEEEKKYLKFVSTTLDGEPIDHTIFADYDLTMVHFYSSYAYPSMEEFAVLETAYQEILYTLPTVNMIQVIIDTPNVIAEQIMKNAYMTHGVTFTGIKTDLTLASWILENLNGIPSTVFVDSTGRVLEPRLKGKHSLAEYMIPLRNIFAQIAPPIIDETDMEVDGSVEIYEESWQKEEVEQIWVDAVSEEEIEEENWQEEVWEEEVIIEWNPDALG